MSSNSAALLQLTAVMGSEPMVSRRPATARPCQGAARMSDPRRLLVEPWLVRAARARPDHEALRTPEGSLSYAELLRAARRVAGAVETGTIVALALPPGRDFVVALH